MMSQNSLGLKTVLETIYSETLLKAEPILTLDEDVEFLRSPRIVLHGNLVR